MNNSTKKITRIAIVGALYCALTLMIYPLSFGPIQMRVSEVMCILPLFIPESAWGLTLGCLIANCFSSNPALDIPLGTSATLIASLLTRFIARKIDFTALKIALTIIFNTLANAFIVPFAILSVSEIVESYWVVSLQVGLGELGVLCVLGIPFYFIANKLNDKRLL